MTSTLLQFGAVMLVVMIGFAMALHVLFRDLDSFGETFLGLFKAMLGDTEFFDEFSGGRYDRVATILVVIYLFMVTIMLLNLLVAILSTAHAQVQENTGGTFKVSKARIVDHYRLVVEKDLLPAPFNLVQLVLSLVMVLFAVLHFYVIAVRNDSSNHFYDTGLDFWGRVWERARPRQSIARRVFGRFVFWLVLGPVAVAGGVVLWVLSAFPYAQLVRWEVLEFRHSFENFEVVDSVDFLEYSPGCWDSSRMWLLVSYGSLRLLQGLVFMLVYCWGWLLTGFECVRVFVTSAVVAPCCLLGMWLIPVGRAIQCGFRELRGSCCGETEGVQQPSNRRIRIGIVTIESMLRKGRGGVGADKLRELLENPMDDDDVRHDEKTRQATVEHLKLLRDRLIKELIDGKELKSKVSEIRNDLKSISSQLKRYAGEVDDS